MLSIVNKNIRTLFLNMPLIVFLVLMPLMQISLIKMTSDNAEMAVNSQGASLFVNTTFISHAENSFLIQTYASGILVQFILIAGILGAALIVGERENNTLMRVFSAPITKLKVLLGILIGHLITIILITTILISATYFIFDINWGDSIINLIVVSLMAAFVSTALAFAVSGIFKSSKICGGVMSVIIIAMTFASGGLIQSDKLEHISKFTINKWISDSYYQLMIGNGISNIAFNLVIIGIIGIVLMAIATVLYRRENSYE